MTHEERPRRLLFVVTGGIAAAHSPLWASALRGHFRAEVRMLVTHQAATMVSTRALTGFTGRPVAGPDWDLAHSDGAQHVALAVWADAVLVYPATLNFCAKLAVGISDDLASSVVMSSTAPVVLLPSIPTGAFNKPATRRVLATLRSDGYLVAGTERAVSVTSGEVEEGGPASLETAVELLANRGMGPAATRT
ncbi:flavoprotein [Streptomyces sp. HB132]|uniref:flavoprotein n=1 Tax=Streptomyces sp. HB132 TaxID=767388 RepID=UPI001960E63D|nr:flavoprotein [Streptomyces sp. HB132]MBM7440430.1 phosphopantothenoylcysteine decarboxylase/phosphopantothenate--cysteine ligase [Streptomyces sp. HB132]